MPDEKYDAERDRQAKGELADERVAEVRAPARRPNNFEIGRDAADNESRAVERRGPPRLERQNGSLMRKQGKRHAVAGAKHTPRVRARASRRLNRPRFARCAERRARGDGRSQITSAGSSHSRRGSSRAVRRASGMSRSVPREVLLHVKLPRRAGRAHVAHEAENRPFRAPRPVVPPEHP